jgi:CDP-glycerol glycerophosphotransferase
VSTTPFLTVIVPVYRVEPFLRRCLDSILAGAPDGVEVVAVDDRSPDRCGDLLDAYQRADDRVRVLHLAENVGLGRARNAGLDAARGEYVWFVDSDDWLPRGSVAAVVDRLRAARPDVLLVDHVRTYGGGRRAVDASSHVLHGRSDEPSVSLAQRPELLRVLHTAWNKVVRRDFLDELELRFPTGYYEDYLFSHPILMAARRISVLDRVCYYYRQRRPGTQITRTAGPRHFDAFLQYDRLFALLDRWGRDYDRWRPQLFHLMINHLVVIAGNEARVPSDLRRRFFSRTAWYYHLYRPRDGYPRPRGACLVKHLLVRMDAFRAYETFRWCYRISRRLRRGLTPAVALPEALPSTPRRPARRAGWAEVDVKTGGRTRAEGSFVHVR